MFRFGAVQLARRARQLGSAKTFAQCENGTTAVEFALIAAPFFALLIAIFQTALIFYASRVLDEIVEQSSRLILTGQAQTSTPPMTQAGFANTVCQQTVALFNCANFMINVQSYSSFSSISTATPNLTFDANGNVTNAWSFNPGNPGDVVVVQVMYQWPIVLGPLGFTLSNMNNGNRLLVSTAVFKNEPYK
jgi:Flp pilus assembly protein TadG